MSEKEFSALCKRLLVEYVNSRNERTGAKTITEDDVYIVWECKVLQNNKALLSTNLPDGMYFEFTYNGNKKELYLDAYRKRENIAIDLTLEFPENDIVSEAPEGAKINSLEDTVAMMTSADYKERFKAEYRQLQIRMDKLTTMLSAWESGKLKFTPTCSYDLLAAQLNAMSIYAHFLQERADIEGIEL